ncbi:MAG: hypothetical protein V2J13_11000, partial [Cycloclasticus sp.]|nr:hypothetical protein [Cycloclasticus sp.]
KRNGRSRLSCLRAPRPRPLLTPPNDGTQRQSKLDLRVALKKGAGQVRQMPMIGSYQATLSICDI